MRGLLTFEVEKELYFRLPESGGSGISRIIFEVFNTEYCRRPVCEFTFTCVTVK